MNNLKKTLIVIVGPTAVGKTAMAIKLAKYYKTEIISADSRQFYKELNIGVASPSLDELLQAKHHFIATHSISDYYNVSKYENEALECLENIFKINDTAILVGGSGLYINAVCNGIDELPDPEEDLRKEINKLFLKEGIEALRNQLKILDPEYYYQVDLANPNRLMRAIEVCITTGKPYSSLRVNQPKHRSFNIIKIGINCQRELLYNIINHRVDKMIDNGLIEEARNLFPKKNLNALNTVGYKELFDYFERKCSLDFAIEKIKVNTRRYAKRQLTWFKKYEDICWFEVVDYEDIISYINKEL